MSLGKTFLLILALLAPMYAGATAVTFVASDDELNQALVLLDKEEIASLAVSQRFYVESAKQTKDRIRGLAAGLAGVSGKGVYLYGESLDAVLARAIVGNADWGVCARGNFAGILVGGKSSTVRRTCGGGVFGNTQGELRSLIESVDRRERTKAFP